MVTLGQQRGGGWRADSEYATHPIEEILCLLQLIHPLLFLNTNLPANVLNQQREPQRRFALRSVPEGLGKREGADDDRPQDNVERVEGMAGSGVGIESLSKQVGNKRSVDVT